MPKPIDNSAFTDPNLLAFATDAESAAAAALTSHGSLRKAAKHLGVDHKTVSARLTRLQERAAQQGYSPAHDWTHTVPDAHAVKGVSTYYGQDGKPRGQWVKSRARPGTVDAAKSAVLDWIATLDARRPAPAAPPPSGYMPDELTVYPIGDHHLGMFAWAKETGDSDHDLARGESILLETSNALMDRVPNTTHAAVVSVGDFYHADRKDNRTDRGGHALDVDTRWGKVLQVGFRLMRQVIDLALTKHTHVTASVVPGNHDDHSALVLTLFLAAWYRDEPRFSIDTERASATRQYLRFGDTLLCFDHGDKCPPQRLAALIPVEQRAVWSEIRHCHVLRGHIHHDRVIEFPGIRVEHIRVLPPADAWHAGMGFVGSGRDMRAIAYGRTGGERTRYTEALDASPKKG